MSAPNKSFFSSLSGLITGIAGLLTATIAIFGVAASQGWLSSGSKAASSTAPGLTTSTTTSTPSGLGDPSTIFGSSGSSSNAAGGAVPQYGVDATSISFQAVGPTSTSVKVNNTGVVPMTVEAPSITGPGASHFTANNQGCGSVDPGRSCQIQVNFQQAPGTFNATLVVQITGAPRATEVAITATAIL
jgi:hypothetical protein